MWVPVVGGAAGRLSLTTDQPLHGLVAQRITAGAGSMGVANRGYNQEGLSLAEGVGKAFEGYVFARTPSGGQPVQLRVALEDYFSSPPKVLAETKLEVNGGGNWTQLHFTLTPTAATACRAFAADTPPIWCKLGQLSGKGDGGHACLQCSGQLAIYLETAGATVDLDYAFFQPGSWGRYKGLPLPLLSESAEFLQKGGYSLIRTGGTVSADTRLIPGACCLLAAAAATWMIAMVAWPCLHAVRRS